MLKMTPDVFWSLTYYEFIQAKAGYIEETQRDNISIGWYAACFTRSKRLKDLKTILRPIISDSQTERRLEEDHEYYLRNKDKFKLPDKG
jgi:hypothetical protein